MEYRITSFGSVDKDFWNNLEKLRKMLIIFSPKPTKRDNSGFLPQHDAKVREYDNSPSVCPDIANQDSIKQQLLKKIKKLFEEFVNDRENKRNATLSIPNRSLWKNTNFKKNKGIELIEHPVLKIVGKGGRKDSSKRLVLVQYMLTKIYKLIETDSYKTKRELYYEDVTLYKTQSVLDNILDDIACLLNASKIHLHVLTTSKGCIVGKLTFKDAEGNYIICSESSQGVLIPSNIQEISNCTGIHKCFSAGFKNNSRTKSMSANFICGMNLNVEKDIQSDARFILVVEKSAVYQMLIDCNLTSLLHPCIMLTGKGFPDVNTREMLRKLSEILNIPVFGLFDADPYGIEILGIYKYGSKAMAFDVKNLAVPEMLWLGLFPTDIQRLHLPSVSTITMTENDIKKANHLLNLPYIQYHNQWLNEVKTLLEMGKKAEIEGLSKLHQFFLPTIYLPNKIKYGGWI